MELPAGYDTMGEINWLAGRFSEAEKNFLEAQQKQPQFLEGLEFSKAAFARFLAGDMAGADELFTKFGRASGTFKDPNVYGPFLIPGLLYAVHQCLTRPLHRAAVPAIMALVLGFAILLSFSRGAWINMAIAVAIYGYCSFISAPTNLHRLKMIAVSAAGAFVILGALVVATQVDGVGR